MHPLVALRVPSPTGGDNVQVRIVLAIAAMRLDDHNVAALEGLATDRTKEVVQALHPAWHERTQYVVCVLIKRFPQHLGHGQHNMTIDDAVMQHLTDLTDPMVDIDLPASQAQRRLTTHGDPMCALTTMQAPVFDVPHLVRVPACEHLLHEVIIGEVMVTRMRLFQPVPVISKNLFENGPALRECCMHQAASRWGCWYLCSGVLLPRPASQVHPVIRPHCGTLTHQPHP